MKKLYEDRTMYDDFKSDQEYVEMLEASIEKAQTGFLIADAEGKVIRVNQAQINITGQAPSYNVGRKMKEVQKDDNSPSGTVIVCETLKPATIEQTLPNGRSYLVYSNPYFGEDGKLKYVISNLIDATEIKKTKESLGEIKNDNIRLNIELQELQSRIETRNNVIHQSKVMRQIILLCNKIAQFDSNILIQGESGVGKELIAEYIVQKSIRNRKPFIKINCAALPERLIESELFGYEAGSFTSASTKGKKGILEYANEGTILLDEVSELALSIQAKLLRFIQEGEFYRIGGVKPVNTDVRILAATNHNLEDLIKDGKFREDLYYRLNVIPVVVPPLRERKEDIPLLTGYFVNKFNEKHNLKKSIEIQAVNTLQKFPFYGNVRELQNTIERILVLSETDVIHPKDVLYFMQGIATEDSTNRENGLREIMQRYEEEVLREHIKEYKTQEALCKVLKVSQSTISRKLEAHGIKLNTQ